MDGILIIDKPAGITSHDVVARCRRILKTKRVGHTGTLDPFATGVVVILVGKATRLAQFLDKDRKEYEAVVRLGFETDTGDLTGRRKAEGSWQLADGGRQTAISVERIEDVLKDFRGEIEQTPPMYSAKKVEGKKLYELARKGLEIERKPVKITIYELELIESGQPSAVSRQPENEDRRPTTDDRTIRVVCSAGTYIRTLAEDIGRRLETGAHLAELRRTRAGKFALAQAATLEELEEIAAGNKLAEVLISMNEALAHVPEIKLSDEELRKTRNGMKMRFEAAETEDNQPFRLTDESENLIAVGFYDKAEKIIQPKVVLV